MTTDEAAVVRAYLAVDLEALADATAETLAAPALPVALRRAVVRALHDQHQFAVVDAVATAALEAGFARALAVIARGEDAAAAFAAECAARARLLPAPAATVTCGTYAPTLQLDVLGLALADVRGPILDVGCGPRALLVAALRAAGLDAHGVDRHLDAPGPGLIAADWAALPVAPGAWQTIVSHLALSLHLLHHHAAAAVAPAQALARTWRGLLDGLAAEGVLAYVPGLPMLERALPRGAFVVTRRALPAELEAALAPLSRAVGEDVAYAAVVHRAPNAFP